MDEQMKQNTREFVDNLNLLLRFGWVFVATYVEKDYLETYLNHIQADFEVIKGIDGGENGYKIVTK